jgi:putative peptidoglycan lipid II flippase
VTEPTDLPVPLLEEPRVAPRRSATYIGTFVLAGRIVERLAAFGQVVVVATVFGSGYEADLYFIASVVPLMLGFVVADALAAVVLPLLVRLPRERRSEVAAGGFWISVAVLGALTLVYAAVATVVVLVAKPAGGGPATWLAFATIILTLGLSGYLSAVLLELERYVWPPFRLAAASVAGLVLAIFAATLFDGILPLALATAGGYVVALVLMLVELRRALGGSLLLRPTRIGMRDVAGTWRKALAAVASGLIGGQLFVVIERLLAASAGVGAVSTLSYARGVALAPNIAAQGVAGGIYPGMVRSYEADDRVAVGQRFVRGLRLTLFLGLVLAAFLALYAHNVAAFVFERGAFDASAVAPVATALAAFTPALLGNMLMILAWRVFYAIDYFPGTVAVMGVALAVYVPLALVLREAHGAAGLAFSFGIAELTAGVVAVGLVAYKLQLRLPTLAREAMVPVVLRAGVVVVAMALYRGLVELMALPAPLKGVVVVGGSVVVGLTAATVVLWTSGWPEVGRVKSRIRGILS